MIDQQLRQRGITSPEVLLAISRVPRERFVSEDLVECAYSDQALPIECEQTISQPYIVGLMTQALELTRQETVLEIGTGSGYQAAVLAEIVLPEAGRTDVDAFGLHPAALDAALHAAGFVELGERSRGGMPFSWEGVTLHASGAGTLRVRLTPVADDAIAVAVADGTGAPVVTVDSLVLRGVGELDLDSAGAVARDALFRLDWTPVTPAGEVPGSVVIAGDDVLGLATHPGLGAAHGGVAGPTDLATLVTADGPAPDVVLLGLAAAPVLFNKLPKQMLFFTGLYPFIGFWLIWGGTLLAPLVALAGFLVGFAAFKKVEHQSFAMGALAFLVAALVTWFLGGFAIRSAPGPTS